MRKTFLFLMFISSLTALGQSNPPAVGAFQFSAGSWVAAITSASANPAISTPPPVALYCFNSGTNQWVPADSSCFGGGGSSVTIQTNGASNSSQTTLNFITSTTNSVGLTITPSNPSGGNEKFEITGSLLLSALATQAADTIVQNATAGSAAPTAVAMPTCTTGADLYNTTTHAWSCVSAGGYPASEVHAASSSSALHFTTCITGSNTNYVIRFTNILMSASGAKPGIQFSSNGGSTYDSSAIYWWAVLAMANSTPGGGGIPTATATATFVVSDGGQGGSSPNNTINGDVYLYNPASTTSFKFLKGSLVNFSSTGQHLGWSYQGDYENTAAVNAFQVIPDTGTITSGTVTCQPLPN
jgi:hypothetical protein